MQSDLGEKLRRGGEGLHLIFASVRVYRAAFGPRVIKSSRRSQLRSEKLEQR